MAYMDQAKKKRLVAEVKKVIPKDWTVTFGVQHHSGITATIKRAPAYVLDDLVGDNNDRERPYVNEFHLDKCFKGKTLEILQEMKKAINVENHDRSDIMTDYFDVGYHVTIQFGKWDKPCVFADKEEEAAEEAPAEETTGDSPFKHTPTKEDAGRGINIEGRRIGVGDELSDQERTALVGIKLNAAQEDWKRDLAGRIISADLALDEPAQKARSQGHYYFGSDNVVEFPKSVAAIPVTVPSEPTEAEKRAIAEAELARRIIAEMKATAVALVVSDEALGVLAHAAIKALAR